MKRNIILIFLSLILVFQGLCTTAFARSRSLTIDGHNPDASLEDNYYIDQDTPPLALEVHPGDELRIPITADLFTWSDGRAAPDETIDGLARLRRGGVKVGYRILSGVDVLDYVQLEMGTFSGKPFYQFGTNRASGNTAYISVNFLNDYVDLKDKYFRFILTLTVDGKGYEGLTIELCGTYRYDTNVVDRGCTSVTMNEGMVVEAIEPVRNISMNLGSGVVVRRNLVGGQRYYGLAHLKDSIEDLREEWPELYPDVKMVYFLETANMEFGNKVTITPPRGGTYYIYGEDMEFLGMTGQEIPLGGHYFLSTTEMPAFEGDSYTESLTAEPTATRAA